MTARDRRIPPKLPALIYIEANKRSQAREKMRTSIGTHHTHTHTKSYTHNHIHTYMYTYTHASIYTDTDTHRHRYSQNVAGTYITLNFLTDTLEIRKKNKREKLEQYLTQ